MTKFATLYYRVTPPQGDVAISLCRGCMETALAKGYELGKYSSEPACAWCKRAAEDEKAEKKRVKDEAKARPRR